jgi:hemerythrin-like domain-containing protein
MTAPSLPRSDGALPHPIDVLRAEHRIVLTVLDQMETECRRMATHGGLRAAFWQPLLSFFDGFHDQCHHVKEERLLFPLLDSPNQHGQGPSISLRLDHERGRVWRNRIQEALIQGDSARLLASVTSFLDHQRQHIHKEDQLVFPLAMRILGPREIQRLSAAFAQAEDETPLRYPLTSGVEQQES